MTRRMMWFTALVMLVSLSLTQSIAPHAQNRTPRPTRTPNAARSASNTGATATVIAATANALKVKSTPLPKDEAKAAIESYAAQVLGISVNTTAAGGLSTTVTRSLTQTPEGASAQQVAANLAVKSYGATFTKGAASLSYGVGTLSGDVTVDVQGSSLGIYSLSVAGAKVADANAALALAIQTFPGVAGFTYTSYPSTTGFTWYATGSVNGIDPATRKVVVMSEAVILYVVPSQRGNISVTATVGRGEFASAVTMR